MRVSRFQWAHLFAALVLAGAVSLPALAQGGVGHRLPGGANRPDAPKADKTEAEKDAAKEERRARKLQGLPPKWMERLQDMSPEQQEHFLSNNQHFQSLPPERQAQIRRRLQWWNNLTPQQRQEFRDRSKVWEGMTPEQRQHITQELLPRWRQLAPDRKWAIMRHLHALHGLSESDRTAKLNDPAFTKDLNPEDRQMLRELSNLRAGTAPEPPQEHP